MYQGIDTRTIIQVKFKVKVIKITNFCFGVWIRVGRRDINQNFRNKSDHCPWTSALTQNPLTLTLCITVADI